MPATAGDQQGDGTQPAGTDKPSGETPAVEAPGAAPPDPQEQPESFAVGSGKEAADATSRSGQGSARHRFLQEADRLLVEGDVIDSGTKNVFNLPGAGRPRLREIPHEHKKLITQAYICPPDFGNIEASYTRAHQAVILRGPEGYGKLATAIRLLINGGATQIFRLDDSISMSRLQDAVETDLRGRARIEKDSGFILTNPLDFENLRSSALQQLEEPLSRAGTRLIITTSDAVLGPDNELLDYVIDHLSRPVAQDVVTSHLRFLLGPESADSELSRPEINKLIAAVLSPDLSCKKAADLADAIAGEIFLATDALDVDIGRIRAQVSRRNSEDFEIWFHALGDTRTTIFAIALGVLNGLAYDIVVRAAKQLYEIIDNSPDVILAATEGWWPEAPSPFRSSRRRLVSRIRAQVARTEIAGQYGTSLADAIEYQDLGYALSVIIHAWSNYQIQDAMLQWLEDLTDDELEQVRIFAGRALGVLATQSFDYLASKVFVPWARSSQPHRRAAVAYALRFVVADSKLRQNVKRLVTSWYSNRDSPLAQATAARSYGLAIGSLDPIAAVEALDRLSAVDDIRVVISVGDAIVDLLGDASDDLTAPAADDLAQFVVHRLRDALAQPDRTAMAQLVFLILADGLYTQVSGDGSARFASWPFLLWLGQRIRTAGDALAELWRYVLNDARFPEEGEQIMARWASAAESDPDIRDAFVRLVSAMVRGHERTRIIVRRHAEAWLSIENLRPVPLVGQELLAITEAEGTCNGRS